MDTKAHIGMRRPVCEYQGTLSPRVASITWDPRLFHDQTLCAGWEGMGVREAGGEGRCHINDTNASLHIAA